MNKKLQVTINLDEFYLESDERGQESIQSALLSTIKHEVVSEIWCKIRQEVNKEIKDSVINEINSTIRIRINTHIDEYLNTGLLRPYIEGGENITIKDYLHMHITDNRYWQNLGANLAKVAENFAKELSKKYDLMFATEIIMKVKDSGMLDRDKLDKLLNNNQ